ncbi:hypothetical protein ES703_122110 [subsurface metagenome]
MNTNKKTARIADLSPRKAARVAGVLYLIVIVAGVSAEFFVRQRLIVPGDATATANNIMASQWLWRLGFLSDLIMNTSFLLLPLALRVTQSSQQKPCLTYGDIRFGRCLYRVHQYA